MEKNGIFPLLKIPLWDIAVQIYLPFFFFRVKVGSKTAVFFTVTISIILNKVNFKLKLKKIPLPNVLKKH